MKRDYQEPYLRKAERPLFLRPLLILPLSFSLVLLSLHFLFQDKREAADFYAEKITRPILRRLAPYVGKLPFSLTELFFLFLLAGVLFFIARGVSRLYHLPGKRLRRMIRALGSLLALVLILFNMLMFFHVLHFPRTPLGEEIGLDPGETPSVESLTKHCRLLAEELNEQRAALAEDEEGVYMLKDRRAILKAAEKGPRALMKRYDSLNPAIAAAPKNLVSSALFSRMGIAGFFSPFLAEANVNGEQPDIGFPAAALHELGHLHGYAREDDCEFFAFLSGRAHPEADFRYAATFLAWDKLMLELQKRDEEAWREAFSLISAPVRRDIRDRNEFWQSRRGPVSERTKKINDRFLTLSGQESGVQAYNESAVWILRWLIQEEKIS